MAADDEVAAARAARKAARRAELVPDPDSERGRRRATERAIRDEACARIHAMRAANQHSRLRGLDDALLDLAIDISTGYPGSLRTARELLGRTTATTESEADRG